jgi:hypothetical protein
MVSFAVSDAEAVSNNTYHSHVISDPPIPSAIETHGHYCPKLAAGAQIAAISCMEAFAKYLGFQGHEEFSISAIQISLQTIAAGTCKLTNVAGVL